MRNTEKTDVQVIPFPKIQEQTEKYRKAGLNYNKEGSVRKINGKVYIDFIYLDERVRESSGMGWNEKNAKFVRRQLDKIILETETGTFKFAQIFPNSKKVGFFTEKELALSGRKKTPDQILFRDYVWSWYDLVRASGRVEGRTLLGYKSYLNLYLEPYFGEKPFSDFNKILFEKFISWAKKRKYRKKSISNKTINKIFVPLKMVCRDAAIEYGWGVSYNPFFGFKRLPENDSYEKLFPFSLNEQKKIIKELPDHWKPFFKAAFTIGLRQGEQVALKISDIDWSKGILHIKRAITRDEEGKLIVGKTKNKYSRRTIKLIPIMQKTLAEQKKIHDQMKSDFFFCSQEGYMIDPSHLRGRVWKPALGKAGIEYREMKQTRHSFATNALSCGENPLWIAKVMGHRDTDMIIRVYSKYIENAKGFDDGNNLNAFYEDE